MNKTQVVYSLILLLGVFLSSISQVMLKKATQKQYKNKMQEYLNPLVIMAYSMFIGTTLLSILAYKVIPLSMGPILEATSYFYITFFGIKIFKERMNIQKIVALGLIVFGIVIYAGIG